MSGQIYVGQGGGIFQKIGKIASSGYNFARRTKALTNAGNLVGLINHPKAQAISAGLRTVGSVTGTGRKRGGKKRSHKSRK